MFTMVEWQKILDELSNEMEKIYSFYDEGKLEEAKNMLTKQIEKIDAMKKVTEELLIQRMYNDVRRDRLIFLKVIDQSQSMKNLESELKKKIFNIENTQKNQNENIRKLNERIDEWESRR